MDRKSFLQSFAALSMGTLLFKNAGANSSDSLVNGMPSAIIPPYLKKGDTVGITCPAGAVEAQNLQCCISTLEQWGLNVKFGKTVGKRWQRFGGTDAERLEDFQSLIDDEAIQAIIFAKGGYGTMRIIDEVNWDKFRKNPKWLVGYSDLTVVHMHVHSNFNICTVHGNMTNGFNTDPNSPSAASLSNVLFGNRVQYNIKGFPLNRPGITMGKVVGGNLSMVNACAASKSDIRTEGKILFIEDVSEYKYTIDRMMMSLKRSGKLDKLAGLIVGEFTATKTETEETFSMRIEDIISDKVKEYDYPVCFHFPAGHIADNRALKMGVNYELKVGRDAVSLTETV